MKVVLNTKPGKETTVQRIKLLSQIRDWIAHKLISLGGEYKYHLSCIVATNIGKPMFVAQLTNLLSLSNFITASHKTLKSVKNRVEETLQQNQMLTTISKKVGKKPNNTKSKFSKLLFAAFTKGNRAPNGRAKGVRYWLLSQYKHLTHHPERPHERKEDSFFESFCNYMESLQSRGKLIIYV